MRHERREEIARANAGGAVSPRAGRQWAGVAALGVGVHLDAMSDRARVFLFRVAKRAGLFGLVSVVLLTSLAASWCGVEGLQ